LSYVISIGEMLIDFIPERRKDTAEGGEACYHPHPGGAPANVAVAIARLGGASRFIGKLSEDTFGHMLAQVLRDNSVDTRYIRTTDHGPTALALVTLQADGQRAFTFYREHTADVLLEVIDVDWHAWQDAVVCHAGSVSLSTEPCRSATLAAIEYTRQAGSIVSFDVNVRPAFWSSDEALRETLVEVIERTDILKFSTEEAHFLDASGHAPLEPIERSQLNVLGDALLEKGPRLVMITLGPQGALLMTQKHKVEVEAVPVRAIDTTGAGDAFMGAVLYALIQQGYDSPAALSEITESDLNRVGSFASKVAALCCTRLGGIASLPFIAEVNSFQVE
jgi:fructokinase